MRSPDDHSHGPPAIDFAIREAALTDSQIDATRLNLDTGMRERAELGNPRSLLRGPTHSIWTTAKQVIHPRNHLPCQLTPYFLKCPFFRKPGHVPQTFLQIAVSCLFPNNSSIPKILSHACLYQPIFSGQNSGICQASSQMAEESFVFIKSTVSYSSLTAITFNGNRMVAMVVVSSFVINFGYSYI